MTDINSRKESPSPEIPHLAEAPVPGQPDHAQAKALVTQVKPVTIEESNNVEKEKFTDFQTQQSFHASNPDMDTCKAVNRKTSGLFAFSNTEAIKEKVRATRLNKENPPYDVHDCYYAEGTSYFADVARNLYFENTTLGVIVLNAFWISIDTDGNTADTINDAKAVYVVADVLFFSYFVAELFIRFMAFENKINCMKDPWFVFDSALVTLYAFDPFALGVITAASGGDGLNLPTAVLRLFRLARLSRLVRMLRSLPELMIMIKGMLQAAASVGYTLGLLLVITYVFSIAFRNLVPDAKDKEVEEEYGDGAIEIVYFKSVPESIHNLMIYAVFLDNLSEFILAVKEQSVPCFILSWLYIALAALTVLNMLIGVLCEVITSVADEEKETMITDKVRDKFASILERLDQNGDKHLSWDEFKVIAVDKEAIRTLKSVNVDPECLIDVAEDFFNEDGKKIFVTFEEFMTMVLELRAGEHCRVEHVLSTGKSFTGKFLKASERMATIEEKVGLIHGRIDALLEKKKEAIARGSPTERKSTMK